MFYVRDGGKGDIVCQWGRSGERLKSRSLFDLYMEVGGKDLTEV